MTFKFVAKNLQTGKTGAVTVKADRETAARQKLQLSGYEVVRLVRVDSGEAQLKVLTTSTASQAAPRAAFRAPSRRLALRIKLGALLHDVLAPFALFA